MVRLGKRIERIKLITFVNALRRSFPELDLPDRVPAMILCPLHSERTPSFSLREHMFKCFGCGAGGDVIDFAQQHLQCSLVEAIEHVERALGFTDEADADLRALIAVASVPAIETVMSSGDWERALNELADSVWRRTWSYTHCADPDVQGLTWPVVEYLYAEVRQAALDGPPLTLRLAREQLRELRAWTDGWIGQVEADAARALGKDPLDVAAQGPLGR